MERARAALAGRVNDAPSTYMASKLQGMLGAAYDGMTGVAEGFLNKGGGPVFGHDNLYNLGRIAGGVGGLVGDGMAMAAGTAMQGGGLALDATGAGAPAGVATHVAGASVFAVGAAGATVHLASIKESVLHPRSSPESPALKGSDYHPATVESRVRPAYRANPAHDPKSPSFNPKKTPEPADAESVYKTATRGDMGTWYGKGKEGWYRYFSDNAGGVHFSGIVKDVPAWIVRSFF